MEKEKGREIKIVDLSGTILFWRSRKVAVKKWTKSSKSAFLVTGLK